MPWFALLMLTSIVKSDAPVLTLDGHPLRIAWHDLDGDGVRDLIALMIRNKSESDIEAFYAQGTIWGAYAEHTEKDTYLVCYLRKDNQFQLDLRTEFGTEHIVGIHIEKDQPGRLWIWDQRGLHQWKWSIDGWATEWSRPLPALQAPVPLTSPELPILLRNNGGLLWLVPDIEGTHLVSQETHFLDYPEHAIEQHGSMQGDYQAMEITVPILLNVYGGDQKDLVFSSSDDHTVYRANDFSSETLQHEGQLFDLNNDQFADLIQVEEVDDVEGPKDLPKMKSIIRYYLAKSPLTFDEEPNVEQEVPGIVFTTASTPLTMTDPFFDMNGDGLMDLAGVAMKFSVFQMAKIVAIGRMKMTFLMHLSVQEADGSFRTLAGGPFEIDWKINIRRLKMPDFGQITADIDGDGWIDIFTAHGRQIKVVPVDNNGIHLKRQYKIKMPAELKDPDQIFGQDMDNDGKAELILTKFTTQTTLISVIKP